MSVWQAPAGARRAVAALGQKVGAKLKPVAQGEGLELAIAAGGPRGLGEVIVKEGSERLIEGVGIVPLQLWPDDRGYFLEVLRVGQGLAAGLSAAAK
jgi:hypothetical protein